MIIYLQKIIYFVNNEKNLSKLLVDLNVNPQL